MSNFVLNPTTHSKIANLLYRAVNYGFNNVGFDLPGANKDAVMSCLNLYPDDLEVAVYKALYIANAHAQAQTYPRDKIDTNNIFIPDYKASTFGIGCGGAKNDCQALKSVECYLYNAECPSTTNDPIIKATKALADALRRKIVVRLDDYKAADWG